MQLEMAAKQLDARVSTFSHGRRALPLDGAVTGAATLPDSVVLAGVAGRGAVSGDGADIDEESRRIQKEIDKFTKLLNGIESKLNQEKFLAKAPQDVIDRERERQKEYTESLSKLEDSLSTLVN